MSFVLPSKAKKHLKTKIDTGANANTLPLRTIKQMDGNRWKYQVFQVHIHQVQIYKFKVVKREIQHCGCTCSNNSRFTHVQEAQGFPIELNA